MNKQTKMILGVGAVAIVGYLIYKSQSKPKSFANALGAPLAKKCCGHTGTIQDGDKTVYKCCRQGEYALSSAGKPCKECTGGTATTTLDQPAGLF